MPIYEYACKACGERFEKLVRTMSGPTTETCPACGKVQAVKVLSSFAVSSEAGGKTTASVPATGGCCPCGKNAGSCQMG